MKENQLTSSHPRGFTLIELLIVVAMIAVLSLVGFTFASKGIKKAKQTKSMSNMRQIAQLIVAYGTDNNGRLMPVKDWRDDGNGGEYHVHWHQAIVEDSVTGKPNGAHIWSKDWWQDNEPIVLNPLFKDHPTWQIWNPGYAINNKIHENIENAFKTNVGEGSWEKRFWGSKPALAAIPDPARTPLLVQSINYHMGGFLSGTMLGSDKRLDLFLIEGKGNVTFVDGHSELLKFTDDKGTRLPVCDYAKRELHLMPKL